MSKNSNPNQSKMEKSKTEVNTPLKSNEYSIQYGAVSSPEDVPLIVPLKPNTCMKIYGILSTLTIEPIIFAFMLAFVMNVSTLTNLMMEKGCRNHFNYSAEVCGNLSGYPTEKKNVEVLATDFSLYSNFMSLIGAFSMIFIAPWSDKHGRKLPLTLAVSGIILTDMGFILCTVNEDSRLEYLLLAKIPSEIFGGFICILTIVYSIASETSSEKNRTIKYTAIEVALGLSMALGALTGGFLYKYYGYFYVYVTCACLHMFCFVWIMFVLEETKGQNSNVGWMEKLKDLFVCKSFVDGFQATFKPREGSKRILLILLLLSMCIIVLTYESLGSIGFVYVHHIYNWEQATYSIVVTSIMLFQLLVTLIVVPILTQVCKLRDFTLGMIGAVSMMVKNLLIAFAMYHKYIFFAGQFSGCAGLMCSLAIRTGVSKLVGKDELGRVFSFLATCEAVLPMMGNIVITKIFEATMDVRPNVTYGMTAALLILPIATFVWAYKSKQIIYNSLSGTVNDSVREKA